MKSYTDIEQSKKLAEILPIESADMEYILEQWIDEKTHRHKEEYCEIPVVKVDDDDCPLQPITHPCWSLAALLDVYPMVVGRDMDMYCCWQNSKNLHSRHYDNPIDACYEMIILLHTKHLL